MLCRRHQQRYLKRPASFCQRRVDHLQGGCLADLVRDRLDLYGIRPDCLQRGSIGTRDIEPAWRSLDRIQPDNPAVDDGRAGRRQRRRDISHRRWEIALQSA